MRPTLRAPDGPVANMTTTPSYWTYGCKGLMGVLAAKQMGAARIIRHYLGAWRARRGADQGIDQRRRRRCCARMRGHAAVDATGDPVGAAGRDDRLCRRASRACGSTVRSCSSRRPGCSGDQRRCAPDRTIGPDRVRTGASAEIRPGRQNVVASDIMSSGDKMSSCDRMSFLPVSGAR